MDRGGELELPVVVMRGGTSKGVFISARHLPAPGPARDGLLLRLMGTPDPMQIDGLGGTHSSTSKVMVISPPTHPGIDLEYEFAQVGIDRAIVDWRGNCGNLTAAVAAYAVDEGYVAPTVPVTTVRMLNTNTGGQIDAQVTIANGRAATAGSTSIAGVPGTGSPIFTEYKNPGGAVTGAVLPTGAPSTVLEPEVGDRVTASIVDVTSPVVLLHAAEVGMDQLPSPAEINADPSLLARLESIRACAAVACGLASSEATAISESPAVPRLAVIARAAAHELPTGESLAAAGHDMVVRATSLQRAHHSIPLTTAMCVAAASRIPGTLAYQPAPTSETVRIAHPKGVIAIDVHVARDGHPNAAISGVTVVRTARRLLRGTALVQLA